MRLGVDYVRGHGSIQQRASDQGEMAGGRVSTQLLGRPSSMVNSAAGRRLVVST